MLDQAHGPIQSNTLCHQKTGAKNSLNKWILKINDMVLEHMVLGCTTAATKHYGVAVMCMVYLVNRFARGQSRCGIYHMFSTGTGSHMPTAGSHEKLPLKVLQGPESAQDHGRGWGRQETSL